MTAHRLRRACAALSASVVAAACITGVAPGTARAQPDVRFELIAQGLTAPLQLEHPADGSGRRLVVQQDGLVRVLRADGQLDAQPFLDLRPRLLPLEQGFEERGLLGLALHPQFARNGRVYATYGAPLRAGAPPAWNHTRRVSEFTAAPGDLSRVDIASERVLMELDWPSRKHNGGGLAFGPDGFLYVGFGDGGISHGVGPKVIWEAFDVPAAGLAWDHLAQDRDSWFGKVLRIDVDRGFPGYAVPRGNPFAGRDGGGKPEIWAWGFRNPFRLSFDRAGNGDFYVTAVAETLWEAVYRVRAPGNFGWPLLEGTHCVDRLRPRQPPPRCARVDAEGTKLELPVVEYANMQASHPATQLGIPGVGTAVTGARIYRGRALPQWSGKLVVADWSADFRKASGQLFVAAPAAPPDALWPMVRAQGLDTRIIGLEEDREGELYVLTNETLGPHGQTGRIFKVVPAR